jgi:hypothetical protein
LKKIFEIGSQFQPCRSSARHIETNRHACSEDFYPREQYRQNRLHLSNPECAISIEQTTVSDSIDSWCCPTQNGSTTDCDVHRGE